MEETGETEEGSGMENGGMEGWRGGPTARSPVFKAPCRGTHAALQRALLVGASVMNPLMLWRGQAWVKPLTGFVRRVPFGLQPPPGATSSKRRDRAAWMIRTTP
jgi:hypothetical protein